MDTRGRRGRASTGSELAAALAAPLAGLRTATSRQLRHVDVVSGVALGKSNVGVAPVKRSPAPQHLALSWIRTASSSTSLLVMATLR